MATLTLLLRDRVLVDFRGPPNGVEIIPPSKQFGIVRSSDMCITTNGAKTSRTPQGDPEPSYPSLD
jgi:hypothetical protein